MKIDVNPIEVSRNEDVVFSLQERLNLLSRHFDNRVDFCIYHSSDDNGLYSIIADSFNSPLVLTSCRSLNSIVAYIDGLFDMYIHFHYFLTNKSL